MNRYVIFIGGVALGLPLSYFIRKYFQEEEDEIVNEVMFFCNDGVACRQHFQQEFMKKQSCDLVNCSIYNLRKMQNYLTQAERSIDVCLYLITVLDLCQTIIKAHRNGVKVRVITDEDMANGSGSQIHKFRQKGIPVRHQHKSTTLMHHKFVVIDKRLVMTGSLNWTMQAICGNWDNLIVTSQPQIVKAFNLEYEKLWTNLK